MQEMGANTVRVYITLHDDFYNAFYEYNTAREESERGTALAHPRRMGERLYPKLPPRRL